MDNSSEVLAGIVLCGGKSSRMGRAKADLAFGSETMLQRVVRLLSQVVTDVVIVAAAEQTVPDLGDNVHVARDRLAHAGPLAGLGIGLAELRSCSPNSTAAYVTSCDVPFLKPEFVQLLFSQIAGHDVVVPFDAQHVHPLAAVYRTNLFHKVEELIANGERRPCGLFDVVRTLRVPTKSLEQVDSGLLTLVNLNTLAEYRAALTQDGSPIPEWLDSPTTKGNSE